MVAHGLIADSDFKSESVIKDNLMKTLGDEDKYDRIITKGNSIDNMKFRVDQAKLIFSSNL